MGGIGIFFGAFGAHGLKSILDSQNLAIFEVGVRYQMYHAMALILCNLPQLNEKWAKRAGLLFIAGIILFCGSLYVLTLANLPWIGVVTPFGGLCFLLGWASLAYSF